MSVRKADISEPLRDHSWSPAVICGSEYPAVQGVTGVLALVERPAVRAGKLAIHPTDEYGGLLQTPNEDSGQSQWAIQEARDIFRDLDQNFQSPMSAVRVWIKIITSICLQEKEQSFGLPINVELYSTNIGRAQSESVFRAIFWTQFQ